ncbi:HGGxSTG domain-containing protein [Rhizobium sp. WYJ-E13]|uniref:HGGxSTG domain-containing protein n=1 Tax=Rhizobium sp. WYJ-E13 TaxID=2849093 RepID=UPI001C1E9891|nr:HGGxSTG domain-containing protein [Rhizobium sp. WYJ-E13]QWW67971.1 hypothetical protein KQ933_20695 [Rhizobium sp. WYJ-E13]
MGSITQRLAAAKNLSDWQRKVRPGLAKCGAKRRRDGEPCQQIAMENGRCHRHGGKTPKAVAWHVPQWPKPANSVDMRIARVEKKRKATAKALARKLAAMTPDELERYRAWQRSHAPGPASERKRRQSDKRLADEIAATLSVPTVLSGEALALQKEIDRLKALVREIEGQTDIFG